MSIPDYYHTIDRASSAEFKERGSKFVSYATPVADTVQFKKYLQELKKEHAKASHHCYAWRLGLTNDNFRVNDDGEPAGTAGKPILGQIDTRLLTNISVIVVRYFGGTLLGVPGLINAYKTSAALALQTTAVIKKPVEVVYSIKFNYTQLNQVMQILKQNRCSIVKQELQLFCEFIAGVPQANHRAISQQINEINGAEMRIMQ